MRTLLAGLVALAMAGTAGADDAVAPPPRVLPSDAPPLGLLPPLGFYRKSAYEVWQNLSVDRQGYWRARVILTPNGAFYRYNGQPFPWTTTQPLLYAPYMPYATD